MSKALSTTGGSPWFEVWGLLCHALVSPDSHGRVWQHGSGRRCGCRCGLAPGAGRNRLLHPPQVRGNPRPGSPRTQAGHGDANLGFLRDNEVDRNLVPASWGVCVKMHRLVKGSAQGLESCVCVKMAATCEGLRTGPGGPQGPRAEWSSGWRVDTSSGHTGRKLRAL